MDPILMMDNQREIINKNINSLKEILDLMTERIKIFEEQIKINDKIDNNEELKEVMKENIDEVINNTNEPKKRGRKPKTIQEGGNEWAAELKSAEPDKKKEKPKHENKYFSNYKNTFTDEQREEAKEKSRNRYYDKQEKKGKIVKKRINKDKVEAVIKRGRGRPKRIN